MSRLDYAYARSEMANIPRGVGAPPPPGMNSSKRGRLVCIKVRMLDDTVTVFHLGHKALGQTLFEEVCRHLNLLESDYFGLSFVDTCGNHCWLDREKAILRQIAAGSSDAKFYFIVKFYTPNPIDLEEEYTRYLFTLQIRRDLAFGELHCAENTAALLAAYLIQSECGDFSEEDYPDATYLSHTRYVPNQTIEFQKKAMENHRNFAGMTPGESDLAMLEVARRCDFYGVKLHSAKLQDIDGNEAALSVMHLGIKVFRQLQLDTTFSWARIRKLSFKRKKLLVKLHPDSYQYLKETIEFVFDTRDECKNFWKKCVEHHAFFRCQHSDEPRRENRFFISKGSSFRYHGRTQRQLIEYVREHHKRREPFTRPLRSGVTSRGTTYASAYAAIGERPRQRNGVANDGNTHASLPHIPHYSHADPSSSEAIYQPIRKKEVIYGINSTFSTESVCTSEPIIKLSRKPMHNMSRSATDTTDLVRVDSSDSGGMSLNEQNLPSRAGSKFLNGDGNPSSGSGVHFLNSDTIEARLGKEEVDDDYYTVSYSEEVSASKSVYTKNQVKLTDVFKEFYWKEITFLNDTEIISTKLYGCMEEQFNSCKLLSSLFSTLKELKTLQTSFLKTLTQTLAEPEEKIAQSISSSVLCSAHNLIPIYQSLIQQYPIYISAIDELTRSKSTFRTEILKFESSDECYIPVNWLLLKIANRLISWQPVLARMIEILLSGGKGDNEITSIRVTLDKIIDFSEKTKSSRTSLEEYVSNLQLEKDIGMIGTLCNPNRKILRFGVVSRWSQRGPCTRVMILCTDRILFAHRTHSADGNYFSVHAEVKLKGLLIDEGDIYRVMKNENETITLHSADKSIVFSTTDRAVWMEDITFAVKNAARDKKDLSSIVLDRREESDIEGARGSVHEDYPTSKLSPLLVCWHRKCSFGLRDVNQMVSNPMSGYLLRKLRNSSGWQKLWVVLSCHSLFFYKSVEETQTLASLSLLDYGIGLPNVEDNVAHENCFKLFYGSHQYFFRADTYYFFERWIESILQAAISKNSLDVVTALALRI